MTQANDTYSNIATDGSVYESGYATQDRAVRTASTNDNHAFGQKRVQQYLNTKDSSAYPFTYKQSPEEARSAMVVQIHSFEQAFYNNSPSNTATNAGSNAGSSPSSNKVHYKYYNNPKNLNTGATR